MTSSFLRTVARFAPSPNGHLHLGHAYSALMNAMFANETGGRFLLRMENIDTTRCRPEFGEGGARRSRLARPTLGPAGCAVSPTISTIMRDALARLERLGLVYPCFCSRGDIMAAVASRSDWPTDPDGTPLYPGTCKHCSAALRSRSASPLANARATGSTWTAPWSWSAATSPGANTAAGPTGSRSTRDTRDLGRRRALAQGHRDELPHRRRGRRRVPGRHRRRARRGSPDGDQPASAPAGAARSADAELPPSRAACATAPGKSSRRACERSRCAPSVKTARRETTCWPVSACRVWISAETLDGGGAGRGVIFQDARHRTRAASHERRRNSAFTSGAQVCDRSHLSGPPLASLLIPPARAAHLPPARADHSAGDIAGHLRAGSAHPQEPSGLCKCHGRIARRCRDIPVASW